MYMCVLSGSWGTETRREIWELSQEENESIGIRKKRAG